MNQYKLVV
ncbi:hypothetical protein D018_2996A, partial [Vibrio parahaemolyticus VP2007-007]